MKIEIEGIELEHRINPRLKHAYLSVENNGTVVLKSNGKRMAHLREFVRSKRGWIENRQRSVQAVPEMSLGQDILLKGEIIPVHNLLEDSHAHRSEDAWRRIYHRLYLEEAGRYLPQRTAVFARETGIGFENIRYRRMKRRWGSCSKEGIIMYNTLLMQLSPELIDYTVVHELAHRIHFNHSPEFHALVRSILPDEKVLRSKIKHLSVVPY